MKKLATALFLFSAATCLNAAWTDGFALKVRAAYLSPADNSDAFSALGIDFAADAIDVEGKWIPEFDITYTFNKNWSAEVVLTIPQDHEVTLAGVGSLGELTHLPPTFSVMYQLANETAFTPYVTAGVNVTLILDDDLVVAGVPLDLDAMSVGFAGGVGLMMELDDRWSLDASVKWIQLDSDVNAGGTTLTKAELDPILGSFGVVYRF